MNKANDIKEASPTPLNADELAKLVSRQDPELICILDRLLEEIDRKLSILSARIDDLESSNERVWKKLNFTEEER